MQPSTGKPCLRHICRREMLRPLRDQILRLSGFEVTSTLSFDEGLKRFQEQPCDLVLIDVEGESGIADAEQLCTNIKTLDPGQTVAFVCNWRVAIETDCPDEIIRTEFDPKAFILGVEEILRK